METGGTDEAWKYKVKEIIQKIAFPRVEEEVNTTVTTTVKLGFWSRMQHIAFLNVCASQHQFLLPQSNEDVHIKYGFK